jgi:sterol 3beta-glucosyltransferase
MKVLLLAPGSRGDVAPAAGLAASFMGDGHEVVVVANREYEALVDHAGCGFVAIDATLDPSGDELGSGSGVKAYMAALRQYMEAAASAALTAVTDVDVVLANTISPYGHDIAEALRVPSAEVLLQPSFPSRAYPPMIASAYDLGPANRLAGRVAQRVSTPYDPACARVRSEMGLPPESRRDAQKRRRREGMPVHHGISAAVLPRPTEWPAELTLDGFWWPPSEPAWTPAPELGQFLADDSAPVVFSLGSMPGGERVAEAVTESLRITGFRAIVQGPDLTGTPSLLPDGQAIHVGDVPHEWLLPRASSVVHHAGAGVASSALRAGTPSVSLPLHTDQPFWARRLHQLSAGTRPAPMKKVTAGQLAALLTEAATSQGLKHGAQALQAAVTKEDGTLALRRWLDCLSL